MRAPGNNLSNRGVINIIYGGAMNEDSNRERKTYSRWLESYVVGTRDRVEEDLVISFGPANLEGVTALHENAQVI